MIFPPYWLPRPARPLDAVTLAAFDELLDGSVRGGSACPVDYRLPAPKWQFLCHAAERGFVLHGSGDPDITVFEPRQADDLSPFGNRAAVYAAADGIWPMYFAILDRVRYEISLTNACIQVSQGDSPLSEPHYFFSIDRLALERDPWRTGTVYLLPADTFEQQEPFGLGNALVHSAQVASLVPVAPVAKLVVQPADFPFLHQIRGHEPAVQAARAAADPSAFPWLDEA